MFPKLYTLAPIRWIWQNRFYVVLGICLFMCFYTMRKPQLESTHTQISATKTVVHQVATTAKATDAAVSAAQHTTENKIGIVAVHRATNTKSTHTVKTTKFAPGTTQPTEIIEDTQVVERVDDNQKTSAETTAKDNVVAKVEETHTTETAATTTDTHVENTTKTVDQKKPVTDDNSRLGLAITSAARPAATYDVIRIRPISLSAIIEGSLQTKQITAAGAGVQFDVVKQGRYYVGAYGVYSLQKKGVGYRAALGIRF